jgi:hypothetical protein
MSAIATIKWIGLDDLRKRLLELPQEMTELAEAIIAEAAEGSAAEIREAYPVGPGDDEYEGGNLRKGVRVRRETAHKPYSVRLAVRSTAQHATLFEVGTVVRYNISRNKQLLKKPANRGFMPGANIFVPIVVRRRREMYEDLTAVIEQVGLDVRR